MGSISEVPNGNKAFRAAQHFTKISVAVWLGYWFHVLFYTFLWVSINANGVLTTISCPTYFIGWPTIWFFMGVGCVMMLGPPVVLSHPLELFVFYFARFYLFLIFVPIIGYLVGSFGYTLNQSFKQDSSVSLISLREKLKIHFKTGILNRKSLKFVAEILVLSILCFFVFVSGFGFVFVLYYLIKVLSEVRKSPVSKQEKTTPVSLPKIEKTSKVVTSLSFDKSFIKKIRWGYLMILLDIPLGLILGLLFFPSSYFFFIFFSDYHIPWLIMRFSNTTLWYIDLLLPDFLGYLLIYLGFRKLPSEEPSFRKVKYLALLSLVITLIHPVVPISAVLVVIGLLVEKSGLIFTLQPWMPIIYRLDIPYYLAAIDLFWFFSALSHFLELYLFVTIIQGIQKYKSLPNPPLRQFTKKVIKIFTFFTLVSIVFPGLSIFLYLIQFLEITSYIVVMFFLSLSGLTLFILIDKTFRNIKNNNTKKT
ncbi:MAG: hypothetical protein ACTSUV_04885 [Candidatus Ranarchaeia archaeon]